MTEPVARAASPRRTVRVAVALVTGQAALCAVIGWVTFGTPDQPRPAATRQIDPLAGPPIVVPTASMALPVPAAPPVTTSAATLRPTASTRAPKPPKPPRPATTTPTRAPTADVSPSTLAGPKPTTPPGASSPANPAVMPAPTPPKVQEPVVVGEPCDPPGAAGRTADGVEVRCVRAGGAPPSWQIN